MAESQMRLRPFDAAALVSAYVAEGIVLLVNEPLSVAAARAFTLAARR